MYGGTIIDSGNPIDSTLFRKAIFMTQQVTPKDNTDTGEAAPLFDDFDLHPEIRESITRMGFETPTPVQARTFEKALKGEDIIAMAQTGTGKTAAFGIPMAQKLNPDKNAVQGLVLTPTRELALQVCKELVKIGDARGIKSVPVYGGASFTKQVDDVKSGAAIIVGTPGRVLDHIRRKTISFAKLDTLVLDEADEMLSMGFEKEISEIIDSLPKKRQTLLFSATIPDDIRRLTKRYMGEAEIISVSGDAIAAKDVAHFVYLVSGEMRQQYMVKVLEAERPDSALIFCNTKEQTQTLARYLKKEGYSAEWLNSDLSQNDRERVMHRIRNHKVQFLVATDVAARGIDVSHLSHVINYSFPESLEVYVHRTGRTGRAGRQGTAISLISPQDIGNLYMLRLTYKIFPVEKSLDDGDERETLELTRLDEIRRSIPIDLDEGYLSLARRLVQDVRAPRMIASLLAEHFRNGSGIPAARAVQEERQKASPKEDVGNGARDKRDRSEAPPAPVSRPPKKSGRVSRPNVDAPTRKMKPEPRTESERPLPEGESEIYVDVGRKDGLKISALMKEIMQRTGLPRTALGKVRMLTRATFISVPKEHFDAVIKAVSSIEVGGAKLKAAPAEPR